MKLDLPATIKVTAKSLSFNNYIQEISVYFKSDNSSTVRPRYLLFKTEMENKVIRAEKILGFSENLKL